ncbi:MAG TPA: GNAT family N-acetyltransferase [Actinomycetota bacterium]|nr:GNAT family N-acetyltransferase [Actinomycetota bacterium]
MREWVRSEDELVVLARAAAAETPPFRHDPGLTVRRATAADGDLYARVIGTDSAATFRRRLDASTHCFLVHLGADLLHASWVTTSAAWTREVRAYIVPPRGDAYVYESFTHPDARGRGVYPFALAGVCEWAAGAGIATVWVAVEEDNAPSFKAIRKAGFEPSFSLRYARRVGRLTLEIDRPPGVAVPDVVRRLEG